MLELAALPRATAIAALLPVTDPLDRLRRSLIRVDPFAGLVTCTTGYNMANPLGRVSFFDNRDKVAQNSEAPVMTGKLEIEDIDRLVDEPQPA